MPIPITEARSQFTNKLIAAYRQVPETTSFLRSLFTEDVSFSKYVSIDVERSGEQVAVDVIRGTEGNRNDFSQNMNKMFLPPYYREWFDATSIDIYDQVFGSNGQVDVGMFSQLTQVTMLRMKQLQDKIDRSCELQCSQVMHTGIVTMVSGDQIDFKRKSGSKIDKGAGAYWATSTVNPYDDLEDACNFLRQVGKMTGGGTVWAIMGATAFQDFMSSPFVKDQNTIKTWKLDDIIPPDRNVTGGVYHGTVSAGSYTVHIWTYPEFYDTNPGKVSTPYIDPKTVIVVPQKPKFVMTYAAVPRLIRGDQPIAAMGVTTTVPGKYVIGDYEDARRDAHVFDIKSAALAVPVAVDQVYTVKVVA